MSQNSKVSWSNLPKHIITDLGSYLPFYFQFELRLLNKYWSKVMNNIIFYSIDKFRSKDFKQIVEKYGIYIKLIADNTPQLISIQKLQYMCPNIDHLALYLPTIDLNNIIQLLEAFPQLSKLELDYNMDYDDNYDLELYTIADLISQLKNLKYISYNIFEPNDLLSKKLFNLKLNSCCIVSQSNNIEEVRQLYTKSHNIRKLYYSVDYSGRNREEEKRCDLITPSFLLNYNTLKALIIWIYYYSDDEGSINEYLSKELLNLFSNTKFYKLTNFEWIFQDSDNLSGYTLFTRPIPKTCYWHNLSRIALFLVDGYLLTYIIKHCPNLVEFCMDSPLMLPICDNFVDLKPMKKLKRLYIEGFHKTVKENEHVFVHLFPNMATLNLCLNQDTLAEDEISVDAYYIPCLFPHLTCAILKTSNCKLSKLIYEYEGRIKWEELYIQLTDANSILLESLLKKLSNLKLLYIYISSPDVQLPLAYNNIRVFSANCLSRNEFNFSIKKEMAQDIALYAKIKPNK